MRVKPIGRLKLLRNVKKEMTKEEFIEEWNSPSPYVRVKTSGSTGAPKEMLVEKRRMLASARMTCDFLGLQPGDTALLCMSLDYIAGKMMVVRALERGLRLVSVEPSGHPLSSKPTPQTPTPNPSRGEGSSDTLSLAKSNQAPLPSGGVGGGCLVDSLSFLAMVPMQVWNTLQVPEERERLWKVRHLLIGGGAINEQLAEALQDFPGNAWSSYGMTETLSHIALRRLNGPDRSEWYTPLPGVSVSLNEEGCLVIRAPHLCDETLVTHDLAEMQNSQPDSPFRILGRRDNVVCSGGIKIQMEAVEEKLRPHISFPFMITKRPDPKFGEVVAMLIEGATIEHCRAICQRVLPKYEQPKYYLVVDHLPLTETGKPARAIAQQMVMG